MQGEGDVTPMGVGGMAQRDEGRTMEMRDSGKNGAN